VRISRADVRGVWTALATPFRRGRVDRDSLRRLVTRQVDAGVAGLCPCGTTGESPTLSDDEQQQVVETVVEASGGRVPVVPGVGTADTHHSVVLAKRARTEGAAAVLVVAPYYSRPPQEGLYRHFRAIADEGGLPVVLYHIPSRTGVSIDVETVARLDRSGGMLALKEAHGTVDRLTRLREACDIPILSGDDALTLPMISLGAVGVVSVASNVVPVSVVGETADALEGRAAAALAAHERLAPLVRALFLETNPIPVKSALLLRRWIASAQVRLPLVPASRATVAALRKALRRLGTDPLPAPSSATKPPS
jgi:4-hydroxy-tetrahydrodipicolinate synthase